MSVTEDTSRAGADCSMRVEKCDADVIIDIMMNMYGKEASGKSYESLGIYSQFYQILEDFLGI